ncbi:flagellar export chaperone FliS [Aromatoleum sp.]|uniref:flagellar export chaperone FliS n=1 Tax=Aromatoleum sp. TaxID=2307007 RepID=UPI002FCC3980
MNYEAYRDYHNVNLGAQTAQASPVQLVLILLDGLLEELARARAHIDAKRYEQKAKSLDKCVDILNGLSSALDVDAGSEVVTNLARLYDYCADRLYKAGVDLDTGIVDEVVGLVTTLRHGWQGVQANHG